ncbi:hemolysin activation/secretion protein [Oxalobacteraceae bacterium GrIS 1.11]
MIVTFRSVVPTPFRLAIALLCALCAPARAQQVDAGQLLQQIDRERALALPRKAAAPVVPAAPAMQAAPGLSVEVKTFTFSGNTLLGEAQLRPAVAAYLGRPLGFADLQAAAASVAEAYRKAGWIVRAYLPQQDVRQGSVTIEIVEAVFGGARIEGPAPTRVKPERLLATIERAQPEGRMLSARQLDRALLLADDLPGVGVVGSLQEGAKTGQTDLILKLVDKPWISGDASVDNTGARAVGAVRALGNVYLNSPLGLADLAGANLMHTRGSDYARLAWSVPLGYDGWRAGASASLLDYRLVANNFNGLNAKGSSTTAGLDLSYPIIRSRQQNLYLGLNLDRKRFDNLANQVTSSHYGNEAFSMALSGNLFDELGGGGANSASLALVSGRLALGAIDPGETAALEGRYTKMRYSASRLQALSAGVALYAALSGQESNARNLDSSEKFYLGGAGGVRAYPADEGGGSSGNLLNLELRWSLPHGLTLSGFFDRGAVRNYDGGKNLSLRGAGLALGWLADSGVNLKASWARRIGENPNSAANGNDQDGSLKKNRIWLTAGIAF